MSDLKIISANCQGLRDKLKRRNVCDFLNNLNANIICLQDTHLTHPDENDLKNFTNWECIINEILDHVKQFYAQTEAESLDGPLKVEEFGEGLA